RGRQRAGPVHPRAHRRVAAARRGPDDTGLRAASPGGGRRTLRRDRHPSERPHGRSRPNPPHHRRPAASLHPQPASERAAHARLRKPPEDLTMTASAEYLAALEAWKARRLAALKAPDGWLNLVGRWWLAPGTIAVGSGADNDVVLPV